MPSKGSPEQTRTATPTDTTNIRPSGTVHPHANNLTESPNPQAPATRSATASGDHRRPPAQAEPASQRHHAPPAGPAVRPTEPSSPGCPSPTRAWAKTRHTPPSRRTPPSPQAREAGPGRRPCRKATPERQRDRQAMQPRRPHRQPSHSARSPQWTPQRKWGDPHSGQKRHHQQRAPPKWRNLAEEWTSKRYSMPVHRAWRQMEAATHRPLANLVRNLKNHGRTPGMRPASTHHQPMGHNPQVAQGPPPWPTWRITPTQARRERLHHGAHLKPARSQKPWKRQPTRQSARPSEKRRPAVTTATKTLSMPSWSPA